MEICCRRGRYATSVVENAPSAVEKKVEGDENAMPSPARRRPLPTPRRHTAPVRADDAAPLLRRARPNTLSTGLKRVLTVVDEQRQYDENSSTPKSGETPVFHSVCGTARRRQVRATKAEGATDTPSATSTPLTRSKMAQLRAEAMNSPFGTPLHQHSIIVNNESAENADVNMTSPKEDEENK